MQNRSYALGGAVSLYRVFALDSITKRHYDCSATSDNWELWVLPDQAEN